MEKGYGNRSTSDVVVFLIPISTTVESGDTGRKPKRNAESTLGLLATLNLHSERLRHRSKYFQILLEKRWSNSKRNTPMEFFLEVHTDVKYYEDCFSRMYAPNFTGILSVEHALELLKVASHIEFAKVMNASVGYLSLVPWSLVEEKMIHKFPFSLYVSSGGLSDLNERLRLHGTKDESYRRLYEVGLDYLRSSSDSALDSARYLESQSSCAMFAAAFNEIVQSGSCYSLAKDAYALVTEKAKTVLQKTAKEVEDSDALETNFKMICWLFEILLNARGAIELVKHIVRDKSFCNRLLEEYGAQYQELFSKFKWPSKWTTTLLSIFEEVLAGRLLLKSSERVSLFSDWDWLFEGVYYDNLAEAAQLTLGSFMMTLPHEYQTTKLKDWLDQVDGDGTDDPCDILEVAYPLWIKNLQRSLVALDSARAEVVPKNPDGLVLLHLPPADELISSGLRKTKISLKWRELQSRTTQGKVRELEQRRLREIQKNKRHVRQELRFPTIWRCEA